MYAEPRNYTPPTSSQELLERLGEGQRFFVGARLDGEELPEVSLDGVNLSHASLRGASLRGASVRHSRLVEVEFDRADLTNARLNGSTLNRASMARVDMTGCSTWDACFLAADLRGAQLRSATLGDANFTRSSLRGADLSGATLSRCTLVSVDFADAIGLDDLVHAGPCAVDLVTAAALAPSHAGFLRGYGLPDSVIDLALASHGAVRYHDCFVSYSHADKVFATRLHDALQGHGVRCWRDEKDMPVGSRMRATINAAIRTRDRVLLVRSKASMGSRWVAQELRTTFDEEDRRGRPILLPVLLDDFLVQRDTGEYASELRDRSGADFTGWEADPDLFDKQVQRVVRALRRLAETD